MTPEKLLTLFKYYHGEDKCPDEYIGTSSRLWWGGEKMIYDETKSSPDFFPYLKNELIDAIEKGHCLGPLLDESISLDQRAIMFYLDLWHGKWFPYDDKDVIFTY